ncbi:MAG: hypothetical protein PHE06_04140, partial [Lachnospiraceae bacterium]|nr:hypothetical protein [Lachnospiraceae bacterium]
MKKRALKKDFRMEIKKSLNRFLSIFFIVAMGVAFFSGIQSAAPDMRVTGDAYYDAVNLMDLRVVSTLGLTDQDISHLAELDDIEAVEPGYMTDVLCGEGENQKVLHVESLQKAMNQLVLDDGRLPERSGECFLDVDFMKAHGYQIGDTLEFIEDGKSETATAPDSAAEAEAAPEPTAGAGTISETAVKTEAAAESQTEPQTEAQTEPQETESGTDSVKIDLGEMDFGSEIDLDAEMDLEDDIDIADDSGNAFSTDTYTIVGCGSSAEYLSYSRGSSSLGNGEVAGFVFILPEDFNSKAYTVAYLTVKGAAELTAYSQEYEDLIEKAQNEVEKIQDVRCEARYQEVVDEANETLGDAKTKIAEGQQKLEQAKQDLKDGKAEADSELEEAKEKLESGELELESGRQELKDSKQELLDAKEQIGAGETQLVSKTQELEDGKSALASGESQIASAQAQLNQGQAEYDAQAAAAKKEMEDGEKQLATAQKKIDQGLEQYQEQKAKLDASAKTIADQTAVLNQSQAQYDAGIAALSEGETAL